MTEGTAILLLVIAELGLVLLIAGIVGAILWTRRRRREQRAMAELMAAVTGRQDTQRVTLTGWLTHYLGYPEREVASRVEQLLEAETEIYRRMVRAIQETDTERLESIVAGMDILTHLYRDTVAAAPGAATDNIAYAAAPAGADDELTKLGEDDGPEGGEDGNSSTGTGAETVTEGPDMDPRFGDDWAPTPEAGEAADFTGDVTPRPAGKGPHEQEAHAETPEEVDTGAPDDTPDQAALDAAWEEALKEQAAGEAAGDPATATPPAPESDPLDDLFDDKDHAEGEPPVHR